MRDCARRLAAPAPQFPHPDEERALARVSKDGASWFETARSLSSGRAFARPDGLLTTRNGLQHRQASRLRAARKGFVERCEFLIAKQEIARRGVFGGVLGR
jgi:hypothetical protein